MAFPWMWGDFLILGPPFKVILVEFLLKVIPRDESTGDPASHSGSFEEHADPFSPSHGMPPLESRPGDEADEQRNHEILPLRLLLFA